MSITIPEIVARQTPANSTWRLLVQGASPTTFLKVAGLNSFSRTPSTTTADGSDFNSGFYGADVPVQAKIVVSATVLRRHDGSSYDAGQEALRAAAEASALVTCRYYDTAILNGESYEGDAYVQWAPQGGAGTGLQSVNITLNIQGADRKIAQPAPAPGTWGAAKYYPSGTILTIGAGTVIATEEGKSGATSPTLPGTVGGTVTDGTVTWKRLT